eukprot:646439-Ditylum_brightwellii.AAC.1
MDQQIQQGHHRYGKRVYPDHFGGKQRPFPCIYLLAKLHKTPWKTCPIVSFASSLFHPLGVWLWHHIHDIVKSIPTYLADSKQWKDDLIQLNIPPGTKIFTAGTASIYTNLKTEFALDAAGK